MTCYTGPVQQYLVFILFNCMKYQIIGSNPKSKLDEKGTEGYCTAFAAPIIYLPNTFYMPGTVLGDLSLECHLKCKNCHYVVREGTRFTTVYFLCSWVF